MRAQRIAGLLISLLALTTLAACTEKAPNTPTPPTTTALDLTGRWGTDLTFLGVSARMTWTLTHNQTNSSVTGPVVVALPTGTVLLNGSLQGTLTGTSLPYTIAVVPGNIPSQPACTGQLGGTMMVNSGAIPMTMTGPFGVVSSSCTISLPSSNITLTRQ